MVNRFKFRAYSYKLSKMIYDPRLPFDGEGGIVETGYYTRNGMDGLCKTPRRETDYDVLMQWTGLKDSQGIDIYEGDIIKAHYEKGVRYVNTDNPRCSADYFEFSIIEWMQEEARFKAKEAVRWDVGRAYTSWHLDEFPIKDAKNITVIGDIHQNRQFIEDLANGIYKYDSDEMRERKL